SVASRLLPGDARAPRGPLRRRGAARQRGAGIRPAGEPGRHGDLRRPPLFRAPRPGTARGARGLGRRVRGAAARGAWMARRAGVACSGAVSSYLGLLAATMRRWVEATLHFESGLEMNARIGARPRLACTQLGYAQMLLARGEPGDTEKALRLLAAVLETAQEL